MYQQKHYTTSVFQLFVLYIYLYLVVGREINQKYTRFSIPVTMIGILNFYIKTIWFFSVKFISFLQSDHSIRSVNTRQRWWGSAWFCISFVSVYHINSSLDTSHVLCHQIIAFRCVYPSPNNQSHCRCQSDAD